jgi:hypothetical protein
MDMDIRGARGARCDVKIEKKCCFAVDDGVKCNLGEGQNGAPNADKRSDRREPKKKQIQAFVSDDIFQVPPTISWHQEFKKKNTDPSFYSAPNKLSYPS